jgi:hypothetical protein
MQLRDAFGPVRGRPHFVQRALVLYGERLTALVAAVALEAVPVPSKALTLALAGMTSHFGSCFLLKGSRK